MTALPALAAFCGPLVLARFLFRSRAVVFGMAWSARSEERAPNTRARSTLPRCHDAQ